MEKLKNLFIKKLQTGLIIFLSILGLLILNGCSLETERGNPAETNKPALPALNQPSTLPFVQPSYADEPENWDLVFSDEFNWEGGLDPAKWEHDIGIGPREDGWGAWQKQYYTDERANSRVTGGNLVITANNNTHSDSPDPVEIKYTSARVVTRNKFTVAHGRIEARLRFPWGTGTWPAFWMMPEDFDNYNWPDCGEIDIAEHVGYDPDMVLSGIHCKKYNYQSGGEEKNHHETVSDAETAFHVYAAEWDHDKIDFYVDEKLVYTFANEHEGLDAWPFDKPFYIIMNIAVGGSWGGHKGVDESIFPTRMYVDYVRVYQRRTPSWPGLWKITNRMSGKSLDIADYSTEWGGNIHQWEYGGGSNQHWYIETTGSYRFKITSAHSWLALDAAGAGTENGTNIAQWPHGGPNQEWYLRYLGDGYFALDHALSGLSLDVADWNQKNGGNIHLWQFGWGENQQWQIEPADTGGNWPGHYAFFSKMNGKCIDIADYSTDWGGNIHQWDYFGSDNQRWTIESVGNDRYKITSIFSGLSLDAAGADTWNGTNLIQWPHGGINQEWYLTDLGNGYFSIVNANNSLAIDVADYSYENGGNLHLWEFNWSDNQQWEIVRVDQ